MSQEGETALGSTWRNFIGFGFYKRSQGRLMRQITFGALALIAVSGAWALNGQLLGVFGDPNKAEQVQQEWVRRFGVCGVVLALGLYLSFRLVNYPRFADFLISVEVEMNKVSWPTRTELIRATIVVIVTMLGLALMLFSFDVLWQFLLGRDGLNILG